MRGSHHYKERRGRSSSSSSSSSTGPRSDSSTSQSSDSDTSSGHRSTRSSSSDGSYSHSRKHRRRRRHRRRPSHSSLLLLVVAAVLAVLLAGGAAVAVLLHDRSTASTPSPSSQTSKKLTTSKETTASPSATRRASALAEDGLDSIASSYSMTRAEMHSLPFPTKALSSTDTSAFLKESWSSQSHGNDYVSFVDDPFPDSESDSNNGTTVLAVSYPKGSYSAKGGGIGGSKFAVLGGSHARAMLSFDVAFADNFDFVKGGKLHGLFAGTGGCSGGTLDDTCTSLRFMFREGGQGEVYGYIRQYSGFCQLKGIICNDEYGQSIERGAWRFRTAVWQQLVLVTALNTGDQPDGLVAVFVDGVKAFERADLLYTEEQQVGWSALYISTFFGGSDDSWAPPVDTFSYVRNFRFWTG